jgi:hypothetical protein
VLSAIGSIFLTYVVQQTALDFFYRVIPGDKSTDGSFLIVVAYLLAIPAAVAVFLAARRRWTRSYAALAGACTGPLLMLAVSGASAWLARLPQPS